LGDYIACSPDGLVGEDGMIEIKILDSNNYFGQVIEMSEKGAEAIESKHYIQMQFNLFVCGRQWCDYVLYNPKHDIIGNGLFIHRVERDSVMQARILEAVDECIPIMNKYVNQYHNIFKSNKGD
jgi:exodeoxyribonuclease (lambda-induced)